MDSIDTSPIVIDGCDTIPKLFRQRVQTGAQEVALREKELGIWRPITWEDYGRKAQQVGMGLIALGLEKGDRVSILSDNNKEWLFADLGVICVGGVSSGVYTTDSAKQLGYLINDSDSKFLFVENDEQLDKALEIRDQCPQLKKIIVFDMEGLRDFHDENVISIEELYDRGRIHISNHPDLWDQRIEDSSQEDLMILIYPSGTTGPPKGAMINHRNVMFQMSNIMTYLPIHPGDSSLSFLPLCHIAERMFTTFYPMMSYSVVNFVEAPDTVPENLREVSPSVFFAVPRLWEKFYSGVTIQLKDATKLGKWAYDKAIGIGMKVADYKLEGQAVPGGLVLLHKAADWLVLRNIKVMLGLDKARWAFTGAAPISPDLVRWYMALGIEMYEVYGQTENCGVTTSNMPDKIKLGSIGVATPNTEVKISDEGEILLKGPHVFMGYLNQPEKTAETIVDGWLHTGDVGEIDNQGFVKITDRMKDIIITAGGKNITPTEIENQLKFSPYISDAVVIGDKRKYLTCLVMIDQDNVEKFAQDHNVPFTNYASLCKAREVVKLIEGEIDAVNRNFARVENIRKFRLIDQLLTAEDDELTPTMKLKRSFVNEKYKGLIDSMYE